MDAIRLSDLSFYAHHGVALEERSLGQRFVVDVRVDIDLRQASRSDGLDATIDYGLIWQAVREAVQGPPLRLIESVAERVAFLVLGRFSPVAGVWVRVSKPGAPIAGAANGIVAVEISRTRADLRADAELLGHESP